MVMTHDELLAKLNPVITVANITKQYQALRAVVELHKPFRIAPTSVRICKGCMTVMIWERCPTIQAIEKELG
jgi:hypothetical protein